MYHRKVNRLTKPEEDKGVIDKNLQREKDEVLSFKVLNRIPENTLYSFYHTGG